MSRGPESMPTARMGPPCSEGARQLTASPQRSLQASFRERMLDLVAEYEAVRLERDKLLGEVSNDDFSDSSPSPVITPISISGSKELMARDSDIQANDQVMQVFDSQACTSGLPAISERTTEVFGGPPLTLRNLSNDKHLANGIGNEIGSLAPVSCCRASRKFSTGFGTHSILEARFSVNAAKVQKFLYGYQDDKKVVSDLFAPRQTQKLSISYTDRLTAVNRTTRVSEKVARMSRLSDRSDTTCDGEQTCERDTKHSEFYSISGKKVDSFRMKLGSSEADSLRQIGSNAIKWGINDDMRRPLRRARRSCADWVLGTQAGQWLFLILVGVSIIVVGAVVWGFFAGDEDGFVKELDSSWAKRLWISYCLFIDPGTQTGISASDSEHVKITASIFSIVGYCFNLSFLGMIVELVKDTLARWKKERYRIVLTGHILFLGWTDKTLFLLTEMLEVAAKNGHQVVILAMRDEHEMMQEIRHHFFQDLRLIRHVKVCRGCPYDVDDLLHVSAGSAQNIIVLCRKGSQANLQMVRVMVALAALPQEVTGKVTAEVWDADAGPVLEVLMSNTNGISARPAIRSLFCLLVVNPLVAQCMIALCSAEASEELRVVDHPGYVGKTFGQVIRSFSTGVCLGVKSLGCPVRVAPSEDYIIEDTDHFLVIARGKRQKGHFSQSTNLLPVSDDRDILVCVGWSEDFVEILNLLDKIVPKVYKVYILSEKEQVERDAELANIELGNLELHHIDGSCTSVTKLAALPLRQASAIMVLSEASRPAQTFDSSVTDDDIAGDDAITTDSSSLMIMLTITGIVEGLFGHARQRDTRARIVCDVFDPRTDQLLARNSALHEHAVFFRSNALDTAMFATAAENPTAFNALNNMLCGIDGGSMMLVPALAYIPSRHSLSDHLEPGEVLGDYCGFSFWDIHERIRNSPEGGLLVGWLRRPHLDQYETDETRQNDVILAPAVNRNKKLEWRVEDHVLIVRGETELETSDPQSAAKSSVAADSREGSLLSVPDTVLASGSYKFLG